MKRGRVNRRKQGFHQLRVNECNGDFCTPPGPPLGVLSVIAMLQQPSDT